MDVSKNRGTPKSSILMGFSIINHPFWVPLFWKQPYIARNYATLTCGQKTQANFFFRRSSHNTGGVGFNYFFFVMCISIWERFPIVIRICFVGGALWYNIPGGDRNHGKGASHVICYFLPGGFLNKLRSLVH